MPIEYESTGKSCIPDEKYCISLFLDQNEQINYKAYSRLGIRKIPLKISSRNVLKDIEQFLDKLNKNGVNNQVRSMVEQGATRAERDELIGRIELIFSLTTNSNNIECDCGELMRAKVVDAYMQKEEQQQVITVNPQIRTRVPDRFLNDISKSEMEELNSKIIENSRARGMLPNLFGQRRDEDCLHGPLLTVKYPESDVLEPPGIKKYTFRIGYDEKNANKLKLVNAGCFDERGIYHDNIGLPTDPYASQRLTECAEEALAGYSRSDVEGEHKYRENAWVCNFNRQYIAYNLRKVFANRQVSVVEVEFESQYARKGSIEPMEKYKARLAECSEDEFEQLHRIHYNGLFGSATSRNALFNGTYYEEKFWENRLLCEQIKDPGVSGRLKIMRCRTSAIDKGTANGKLPFQTVIYDENNYVAYKKRTVDYSRERDVVFSHVCRDNPPVTDDEALAGFDGGSRLRIIKAVVDTIAKHKEALQAVISEREEIKRQTMETQQQQEKMLVTDNNVHSVERTLTTPADMLRESKNEYMRQFMTGEQSTITPMNESAVIDEMDLGRFPEGDIVVRIENPFIKRSTHDVGSEYAFDKSVYKRLLALRQIKRDASCNNEQGNASVMGKGGNTYSKEESDSKAMTFAPSSKADASTDSAREKSPLSESSLLTPYRAYAKRHSEKEPMNGL